jgi:hypothetical protein
MQLYRLCRQRYAELSGFGAKKTGGRWNRKGIAALYTAQNAALAVLEVLVHLDKAEISVPDPAIVSIDHQSDERLEFLYQNGHRGLASESIGFSIPSIIVPHDRVVVLYPEAAISTSSLAITTVAPFAFDRYFFRQRHFANTPTRDIGVALQTCTTHGKDSCRTEVLGINGTESCHKSSPCVNYLTDTPRKGGQLKKGKLTHAKAWFIG